MSSHTVEDSFDRTDSTSTLGATDGGDTPKSWSPAGNATWGINGNKAYVPIAGDDNAYSFALVSLAAEIYTVGVKLDTLPTSPGSVGLVVRYSSTANFVLFIADGTDGNQLKLIKVEGGVNSQIGGPYAAVSGGDTIGVAAFTIGTDHYLELSRNGSFIADVISPFNTSAVRHGLYSNENEITNLGRFDNFVASYDDATITPGGGDGSCLTVAVPDFLADSATSDGDGIVYTPTSVAGWYDSIPMRSATTEMQPRGETIVVAQELGRDIALEIVAHAPGGQAELGGPLCFTAMETIKAAFRNIYVPVLMQVVDPYADRQMLVRRVGPIKQQILGHCTAVRFSIPLLGEDPRRFAS